MSNPLAATSVATRKGNFPSWKPQCVYTKEKGGGRREEGRERRVEGRENEGGKKGGGDKEKGRGEGEGRRGRRKEATYYPGYTTSSC